MNANGDIQKFNSIIEGKACNRNTRAVYLQQPQCKFKWNTYDLDKKGKHIKDELPFNEKYKEKPLQPNKCETFSIKKEIDPTEKK